MKKIIGTVATVCVVLTLVVLSIVFGTGSFSRLQLDTLSVLLIVCGCSIVYCFVVGEITKNYSQMDKLWSLLPIVYTWIIAAKGGMDIRLVVYAIIVTAWGIRLTVNFARKGAYRLRFWEGNEDYRWSIVRGSPFFRHSVAWTLFDLLFISMYQNLLVLAICLPALSCMESVQPFGAPDFAAAALAVAFLVLETVSDEYQWKFHQTKKRLLSGGKKPEDIERPYDLGFNTLGPWAYMRHPNYLGEQGVWLSLYIFVIGAGAVNCGVFNVTFIGPLLLVLLFIGSSTLGEKISSGKYPAYKDYMEKVCKYLPIKKYSR